MSKSKCIFGVEDTKSKCIFRVEDMKGKVIHINDYVKFDWDLAKQKHPKDYKTNYGGAISKIISDCYKDSDETSLTSKTIFRVKGFSYFESYDNTPCFYTEHNIPHYVDCCEVIEKPLEEDCSIFIEY